VTKPAYPPEEARGLWVYLEQDQGRLEGVSLELLGKAREMADSRGMAVTGALLGDQVSALVQEAIAVIYLFQGREMVGVRSLLQAVFAALLLFTFALQHDLIHKQASIRIHNKHRVSKAEIQTP